MRKQERIKAANAGSRQNPPAMLRAGFAALHDAWRTRQAACAAGLLSANAGGGAEGDAARDDHEQDEQHEDRPGRAAGFHAGDGMRTTGRVQGSGLGENRFRATRVAVCPMNGHRQRHRGRAPRRRGRRKRFGRGVHARKLRRVGRFQRKKHLLSVVLPSAYGIRPDAVTVNTQADLP